MMVRVHDYRRRVMDEGVETPRLVVGVRRPRLVVGVRRIKLDGSTEKKLWCYPGRMV